MLSWIDARRNYVWLALLVGWTYFLVVPTYWLPDWLNFPPGNGGKSLSWGKIGHIATYALLSFSIWALPAKRELFWLGLVAHGGITEIIQLFIPTRTGKWYDFGLDLTGVLIGLELGFLVFGAWHWLTRRSPGVAPAPKPEQYPGRKDQNAYVLR